MSARRTRRPACFPLRLQALEGRIAPATFTVSNDANAGAGSLRQAVLDANTAADADVIDFSSYFNVPRTITLASEISVTGPVTIDGTSAANVTISGNNAVRIFKTDDAAAGTAIGLVDLTLKAGSGPDIGGAVRAGDEAVSATRCIFATNLAGDGGAIAVVGGSLTATSCIFSLNVANSTGGSVLFNGNGSLTATDCVFTSNTGYYGGGAIAVGGADANTVLTRCEISGNSAQYGGGLSISGNLLLEASTVSGNQAPGYYGYYGYYPGSGGGISASGATTIRNSTISGNSASSGGGINANGTLIVQNSTITGNAANYYGAGGIQGGTVSLESSIVANNSGGDISASTVNAKNSSIFDRSGITTLNDLGGNRPAGEDPRLGPLQDNGGPTKTHLLLPGSPCIDAGSNPASLTTDQRGPGFPRVIDGVANIGAVEGVDVTPTVTPISFPPMITAPGGTNYSVVVRFDDGTGIDPTTIDLRDITVTGPGYAVPQSPTSYSVVGAGKSVTVAYTLPAPGGAFDLTDDGLYTVAVVANQVGDSDTPAQHFVAAGFLGTFRVSIPFTLVVDEASDIDDNNTSNGHLSLREAVRLTNAIVGSADTITFDPAAFSSPVTLKLSSGVFVVSDPLTIIGPGAGVLTLDAAGTSQVFNLNPGTGDSVTLSGMTLTNGVAGYGGAVYANCGLILSDVVVSNSHAVNSYSAAGGGVYVNGSLTAKNCTFTANSTSLSYTYYGPLSSSGGAISVSGDLLLVASTVSGNVAIGGYVQGYYNTYYYPGSGGGIAAGGSATIRNSTISGNSAGYGGGINGSTLVVQNSTITDNNGGGISANGTVALESSIVAKNLGAEISANTVNAKNSSVFSHSGITTFNDLGGNRPVGEDPKLGPLANNGGPSKTHRLLPGSPCIDVGSNPANLTTDQRGTGFPRVLDGKADMGAVEDVSPAVTSIITPPTVTVSGGTNYTVVIRYEDDVGIDLTTIDLSDVTVTGPGYAGPQAPTAFAIAGSGKSVTVTYTLPAPGGTFDFTDYGLYTVNMVANQVRDVDMPTPYYVAAGPLGTFQVAIAGTFAVDEASDIDDGNTSKGHLSLREALRLANVFAGTSDTITFDPAAFSAPVTLKLAAGEFAITDPVAIVGPGASRLTLDAGGTSRLFNINLPGTVNPVNLSGLTLINGLTNSNGGAILATNGLTLSGVVISNCLADNSNGAGVFVSGPLTMRDCTVINNKATGNGGGGGIFVYSGAVVIQRSSIVDNQASYIGGGLAITYGSSLQFSDNTIANNTAQSGGGGIFFQGTGTSGSFIRDSTISGNVAGSGSSGGGLALSYYSGTLPIANCTITSNSTTGQGGGIAVNSGKISLNSTIVAGNLAGTGADLYFNTATSVPGDNNLVGVKNSGNFTLTGTGNKTGTTASPLNARLGPLAFNGGPTKTHALLSGSPAIDRGNNAAGLAYDQRGTGFVRVFNGKADIGAFEVQPVPLTVQAVQINDGSAQRSEVRSITVTFSGPVTFTGGTGNAAAAFRLNHVQTGNNVALAAVVSTNAQGQTVVMLSFSGAETDSVSAQHGGAASLADGRYQLTILSANVTGTNGQALAGGGPNGNYVSPGDTFQGNGLHLYRLFGDVSGDGVVDAIDLGLFRSTFNAGMGNPMYITYLDADNSGSVDAQDLGQFRTRFNLNVF